MAEKVVKLGRLYEAHGTTFDEVALRPPLLKDHFAIGEPVEMHRGPDGEGSFVIEHLDRVEAYRDRLIVRPGLEMIQSLDLADSIAVKDAIIGFFLEAHALRSKPTS